ncbi:hypothetical protein N7510_010088 [Penicillium lagena]|uniref:uncharacterized protein n=1 Tax=Penicillium lagena TaxID=94218 RepID=UPI00253FBE9F|nr:uncharacterized protein N7510_010088 [Penicillium lagena]KAJ5604934.1 hypothetical protein N7510_010088 [Penicillium lagena]
MSPPNTFANASPSSNPVSASASTRTSTSEVRSRQRRFVSLMDGDDSTSNSNISYNNDLQQLSSAIPEIGATRSSGATPSPLSSRGVSPLPMIRPSRATESFNRGFRSENTSAWNTSPKQSSSRGAVDFLDSSWSSLQNMASSVLGGDMGRITPNSAAQGLSRRKPSRPDIYFNAPRSSSSTWGPSGRSTPEIGAGTKEERQAMVQAKKREALLLADTGPTSSRDLRHKRRISEDFPDQAPDPEQDDEALAYVHNVQAIDSITGVTIKYGCQAAVFRKANGFWPNDDIQSRNTVLLPVDACTVKGRPVQPRDSVNLLDESSGDPLEDTKDSSIVPLPSPSPARTTFSRTSESERNRTWKHESWVQIDGFPAPVEIGRVPRRSLGFFPRTRRKSTPYTDIEPSGSSRQSPRLPSSPGLPRSSVGKLPGTQPRDEQPKPTGPSYPTRPRHLRQRSSIQLTGTGVGTLDRTSTVPGPALDGLSRFFAQHMPTLAPPPPPANVRRSSFESASTVTSTTSTGLENIGGAFEGWVRKVTTRAKAGITELQQGSPNQRAYDRGRQTGIGGPGDLIELDDTCSLDGRNSPASFAHVPTSDLQGGASLSSSFRFASPSVSATSRSRATAGLGGGVGPNSHTSERLKDD